MQIREILENKHVTFCFGRLNPPHFGHEGLLKTVKDNAEETGGDWYIFASKSHDNKKNPLDYETKVQWLLKLFPWIEGHLIVDPTIRTILQAADWLRSQGYTSATLVAGEDDMETMGNLLKAYNGKESSHGEYRFDPLNFRISPRLTSATNARAAAENGDEAAFQKATRVDSKAKVNGMTLFQATQKGLEKPVKVPKAKAAPKTKTPKNPK